MNARRALVIAWAISLVAASGVSAQTPETEKGDALEKLAGSMEHLAAALEREVGRCEQDKEMQRLQVVTAILGLRYRKIDDIEGEIRSAEREENDVRDHLTLLRVEPDQIDEQARSAEGEANRSAKAEKTALEARVKVQEDRIGKLGERRSLLQGELSEETRRLTHIERILDDWLEKQK